MPITINDTSFLTASEVANRVGISRQTLWRWKKARKVPPGRRYRGREVLYTQQEAQLIEAYANRLEPDDSSFNGHQLNLFANNPQTSASK